MHSEFEFIDHIKKKHSLQLVGDDCAVLPKDHENDLLITSDLLIEDIDFRLDWTTPELLGHKALAVSLSDIAAMGGTPRWAMLSIGAPEKLWKTDFLDRFYEGWHALATAHGVELVGGDVSRSPDKFIVDSIVAGDVGRGKAILRSTARPGDAIFVTGYLGGAAAGLKLLENGERFHPDLAEPARHLLLRQLQPLPQTETGNLLQQMRLPTAMIDVSDGLSSDVAHLARSGRVGAKLFGDQIPIDPAITAVSVVKDQASDLAIDGGEDFELLLTVASEKIPVALELGFHQIGEVTAHTGIVELEKDGNVLRLDAQGFRHF